MFSVAQPVESCDETKRFDRVPVHTKDVWSSPMRIRMNNRALRALSPSGSRARLAVAIAFAGALSAGCDVHTPVGPGTLATITVTPDVTLSINATQQFV